MIQSDRGTTGESNSRPEGSNRGQMLVLTGLVVAVTLILLMAVLNAGLYTGTAATLDQDTNQQEAQAFTYAVATDVEAIHQDFAEENFEARDSAERTAILRDELRELQAEYEELYREENVDVTVRIDDDVELDTAKAIRDHNTEGFNYDEKAGAGDNLVVQGAVLDTFQIEFERDSLAPEAEAFEIAIPGGGGGSDDGSFTFYNDGNGQVVVEDKDGNTCEFDEEGDPIRGDLVAGEIGDCDAIEWPYDDDVEHNVQFNNRDNIEGSYGFVVEDSNHAPEPGKGGEDNPDTMLVFKSITVTVEYQTTDLELNDQMEVDPNRDLLP